MTQTPTSTSNNQQAGSSTHENIFSGIIDVINGLGDSLVKTEDGMEIANWIRIAKISKLSTNPSNDTTIVKGVKNGVKLVLVPSIFSLVKLVIKAQAMMDQLDSAKALSDVSLEILNQVASEDFFKPFETVFDIPNPFKGSNTSTNSAVDAVKGLVKAIPTRKDIDDLGASLAKLIVLRYTESGAINPDTSGKIRLLWWATADSGDNLDLPFSEKCDATSLSSQPSSYWLGSTSSQQPQQSSLNLGASDSGDSGLILFSANAPEHSRTPSWADDRDQIAKALGYDSYVNFKASCKPIGGQQEPTDEVALNRLWGVDLSDLRNPKLAGLPQKSVTQQ
jgi:hypothetical protein